MSAPISAAGLAAFLDRPGTGGWAAVALTPTGAWEHLDSDVDALVLAGAERTVRMVPLAAAGDTVDFLQITLPAAVEVLSAIPTPTIVIAGHEVTWLWQLTASQPLELVARASQLVEDHLGVMRQGHGPLRPLLVPGTVDDHGVLVEAATAGKATTLEVLLPHGVMAAGIDLSSIQREEAVR